jgi:methylglyoxal synthase
MKRSASAPAPARLRHRVALIAHDGAKARLASWAMTHRDVLRRFRLVATAKTGQLLREKVGLDLDEVLPGPQGGDTQIAAMVVTGVVSAVFFIEDPLCAMPHDPDIRALLRVCNVHNVPLATNLATAELVIAALAAPGGRRPESVV